MMQEAVVQEARRRSTAMLVETKASMQVQVEAAAMAAMVAVESSRTATAPGLVP